MIHINAQLDIYALVDRQHRLLLLQEVDSAVQANFVKEALQQKLIALEELIIHMLVKLHAFNALLGDSAHLLVFKALQIVQSVNIV